jgi:hypothetical protein
MRMKARSRSLSRSTNFAAAPCRPAAYLHVGDVEPPACSPSPAIVANTCDGRPAASTPAGPRAQHRRQDLAGGLLSASPASSPSVSGRQASVPASPYFSSTARPFAATFARSAGIGCHSGTASMRHAATAHDQRSRPASSRSRMYCPSSPHSLTSSPAAARAVPPAVPDSRFRPDPRFTVRPLRLEFDE